MFKRVPKLLDILAKANHPLSKYLKAVIMMLDADRLIAIEGLSKFRELVNISAGLWYIKHWRTKICTDLYKLRPGMFTYQFGHGRKFCGKHQKFDDQTEELCIECLADYEVYCYNDQFEFQTSVIGL